MVGAHAVAGGNQFRTQFGIVIDFAVEQDTNRKILVPHRLMAAGDIDDREAAEAEMKRVLGLDVEAVVVGAAMRDRVRHRLQVGAGAGADEPGQAAHRAISGAAVKARGRD